MKRLVLLGLLTLAFSCSSDDSGSMVEDGVNPRPNQQPAGSSAHDFLSADDYQKLTVEILYIGQYKPSDVAVASLQAFLEARLNKPDGVFITQRQIESPGTSPYTTSEIRKLETDNRTAYNNVGELALCILFVDGRSASDTATGAVLGTAYLNTSCVIYEKHHLGVQQCGQPTTAAHHGKHRVAARTVSPAWASRFRHRNGHRPPRSRPHPPLR
ncbi:hypothetical protein [Flavobacterium sp. N1718]|uniref:hypothetical protein n=1 Tax=Flavobacterium sp. N1718 TaxID=2986822 RepID=UPI002225AD77|nr:hypothetical protein [Flavobacterium sp. N1718]